MIGSLFLLLLVSWIAIVILISKRAPIWLKLKRHQMLVTSLVLLGLMPLPVADEIIGGFEFRKLCKERAVLHVDVERIRYKTIRSISKQTFPSLSPLSIEQWTTNYVDVATGERMASDTWLRAAGGWISRNFTEGRMPITFQNATCRPPLANRIEKLYTFTLIDN